MQLPSQLKIFVGPTQFPADENTYSQIAVELQDPSGNIAAAPSDLQVTMASSDGTIGTTRFTNNNSTIANLRSCNT